MDSEICQQDVVKIEKRNSDGWSRKEEFRFQDWNIECFTSHILPSKCTQPCSDLEPCSFCFFTKEVNVPHLPEMVFPNNKLVLTHKNGCSIEFNALDALKMVKSENKSVKIACAEDWRRARQDSGLVDKTVGEYDWTFTTDYSGTLNNWEMREPTEQSIDTDRLKQKEEILFYRDLTIFEDELHDNGIAVSSVRIRVMPSGFFILLRYFLRVDRVILSVYDTRMYHDVSTDYILKEMTHREARVPELRLPLYIMNDPDQVTPLLPLKKSSKEKLILSTSQQ